jgi:Rieske 2Fe-2S family protein
MTLQEALPRELYVAPAAWARERERVLLREWTCVGRVSDLGLDQPERAAVVEVLGESMVVTSDAGGILHASYNVCRHRGSQLFPTPPGTEPQQCAARSIRCPYHSWTYALDGSLLRAPHTEDEEIDPADFSLHPVGVEAWGGFVFVHPTPEGAADLAESVGRATRTLANYDLGSLVTGLTLRYDVAANWKVVAENYNECYHCGPVHPELSRLVPSFAGGGAGLDWDAGIPHRDGAWTYTMTGTTTRAPLPGLDEDEKARHKGELVYPNLMLSCSADHVAAFVLRPLAVDRTAVECRLLFADAEVASPSFDPSDAGDFWDLVNKQDWAICESVQRGMSSRAYSHGWFAPMEDDSADIRRWLLPRLESSVEPSPSVEPVETTPPVEPVETTPPVEPVETADD